MDNAIGLTMSPPPFAAIRAAQNQCHDLPHTRPKMHDHPKRQVRSSSVAHHTFFYKCSILHSLAFIALYIPQTINTPTVHPCCGCPGFILSITIMNKLAVELLTHISYFACTDGGKTGCSLSLVSKHIHYASRPARFYSVSLIKSAAQIELFLQTYQRERRRSTDTIPRVRHLCLSFFGRGITTAPPAPPTPSSKPTSREEFLASQKSRAQFWRTAQFWLDEQYNRVVPELVRIIAPDLETLALIQTQWRCSTAVKCHFPRLRELTLVGGDPTFIPFSTALDDRPLYPALQRLHHVPSLVNRGIDFFLWAKHAPNLTHLRLSRMGAYPEVTVNTLTQIMSECPIAVPCVSGVLNVFF